MFSIGKKKMSLEITELMRGGLRRFCLIITFSILFLGILETSAQSGKNAAWNPVFLSACKSGLALFEAGKFCRAADAWITAGETFRKESKAPDSLKKAGLANVFATIAFEKDDNARAYTTWSTAIRYFLEGRTVWDEEKRKIQVYNNRIEAELRAADTDSPFAANSNNGELISIRLAGALSLVSYNCPVPGLKVHVMPESRPIIHVSRGYFPRPLLLADEKEETPKKVIQRDLFEDKEKDASVAPELVSAREAKVAKRPEQMEIIEETIPVTPEIKKGKAAGEMEVRSFKTIALPRSEQFATEIFGQKELEIARSAWRYFTANFQQNTGMVNAVHNYSYATMWDMGSALAALIAAEKIGIIQYNEFKERITRFLETMISMELYNHELPNREYNTRTGNMTDLKSRPSHKGSGWSALDIGRILIWLKIARNWYPDLEKLIDKVVERWKFDRACKYRELNGVLFDRKKEFFRQEGRLGYEQYAACGYRLWGHEVAKALDFQEIEWTDILGEKIPFDTRNKAYLTSDPFMLARMELDNIDKEFNGFIHSIYAIQKKRWEKTDIITSVSEDSINQKPWFVYNCIFYEDKPWACVDHKGRSSPNLKSLSSKAAISWSAIFSDDYSASLREAVADLKHPKYGFYAGIFEDGKVNKSRNINTNAVILEAMLYLKMGKKPFIQRKEKNEQN